MSSQRIWSGDPGVVSKVRARYKADAKTGLVPYACALYSFRLHKPFARELVGLGDELVSYAVELCDTKRISNPQEVVDKADCLSTYLEWIARQQDVEAALRLQLLRTSFTTATFGLFVGEEFHASVSAHSRIFIRMTLAKLCMVTGETIHAEQMLCEIAKNIVVKDPNQRARCYAKLGMLYREVGKRRKGFFWGVRALRTPDITHFVRLKCLAALFFEG